MIVLALIFTSIGVADIVRVRVNHKIAPAAAMTLGVALVIGYSTVMGIPWWWVLIVSVLLLGWLSAWRDDESPTYTAWVLAAAAATAVTALAYTKVQSVPSMEILGWYDSLPIVALNQVPFETFALGVGGVLFLVETANVCGSSPPLHREKCRGGGGRGGTDFTSSEMGFRILRYSANSFGTEWLRLEGWADHRTARKAIDPRPGAFRRVHRHRSSDSGERHSPVPRNIKKQRGRLKVGRILGGEPRQLDFSAHGCRPTSFGWTDISQELINTEYKQLRRQS